MWCGVQVCTRVLQAGVVGVVVGVVWGSGVAGDTAEEAVREKRANDGKRMAAQAG